MKLFLQAIGASIAIHLVYFAGVILWGYFKTKNYEPDVAGAWNQVETLQTEVAFGWAGSSVLFLFTILGVALVSGLVVGLYKRFR